jgi:hypothetical protein
MIPLRFTTKDLAEPENSNYVEMLDSALASFASQDPVQSILQTTGRQDDTDAKLGERFGFYFDEKESKQSEHGEASPKKQHKVTFKDSPMADSRRASGVRTRSQTKFLSSDPFLDDNSNAGQPMLDFCAAGKNRLFAQLETERTPNTPPWNVAEESSLSGRLKRASMVSQESSFAFTPMGIPNRGTSLFASRAAEPEHHSSLRMGSPVFEEEDTFEDEDVEMEEL